jgi:tetratricopeptide (TPR) repeat protein
MHNIADTLALAFQSHSEGNSSLAEQHAWCVLHEDPNNANALRLLGLLAQAKGDLDQAIDYFNRSLVCDGSNVITWNDLGNAQVAAGRCQVAVTAFEQALRLRPEFGEAHNNLGVAFERLREWERAVQCFREAIRFMPDFAPAYNNLGLAFKGQGNLPDAAQALEQAVSLQRDNSDMAYNLGVILHLQGEHERAAHCYRQSLIVNPDNLEASNNLAIVLKEQGHLAESIATFRYVLNDQPDFAMGYYNLSEFVADGRYQFSAEELQRIRALLASGRCTAADRSLCCFALGNALDQLGSFDEAFAYYEKGNELRKHTLQESGVGFNACRHEARVDRIIDAYDSDYFAAVKEWGLDSEVPIFIVSVPRSGSTLVEQVLASHPQVFGAGELGDVSQFFKARAQATADAAFVVRSQEEASTLANEFVRRLGKLSSGFERVTIKNLENHLHLGLIATLLPRARIVYCRRDALDVCLSCYFQNFNDAHFSWSLEDIGSYYRAYEKLMAHWSKVLPSQIHEVCYEDLVHNQQAVTRKLIEFCGLDWDEQCLSFYDTRRVVRTASAIQVRKPMSTRAIGRWKHYRAHLDPLYRALGYGPDLVQYANRGFRSNVSVALESGLGEGADAGIHKVDGNPREGVRHVPSTHPV